MEYLVIKCSDSPEDFIKFGKVYGNQANDMYISIELTDAEDPILANVFIDRASAIKIITHLKEQFGI